MLGLYGRQDQSIPQDTIEQMKQALANDPPSAKNSQFVVYDDAPHAFLADYRPSYRKADAEDGWKRTLAWFPSTASNNALSRLFAGRDEAAALHSLHEPG